jgi:hypothetical protein
LKRLEHATPQVRRSEITEPTVKSKTEYPGLDNSVEDALSTKREDTEACKSCSDFQEMVVLKFVGGINGRSSSSISHTMYDNADLKRILGIDLGETLTDVSAPEKTTVEAENWYTEKPSISIPVEDK